MSIFTLKNRHAHVRELTIHKLNKSTALCTGSWNQPGNPPLVLLLNPFPKVVRTNDLIFTCKTQEFNWKI